MVKTNKVTFPFGPMVEVLWEDASTRGGLDDLDVYREHVPVKCLSIGYLLHHDKQRILLVHAQSEDDQANNAIAIPSVWIKAIRTLTPDKTKKRSKRD